MENDFDIILIEDSESDAEIVLRALKRANIQVAVRHLTDGEEALDFIENASVNGDMPKLILLDLKMPKIDGLDVLRRTRLAGRFKSVPVVVLSSSREDKDIRRAYELGANSYVVKPVDYQDFSKLVAHTVEYWLHINQRPV